MKRYPAYSLEEMQEWGDEFIKRNKIREEIQAQVELHVPVDGSTELFSVRLHINGLVETLTEMQLKINSLEKQSKINLD